MSAHFLFRNSPLKAAAFCLILMIGARDLWAQGQSMSPQQSSATQGDTEDEGLTTKKTGKGTHPDDGSDLGEVTLSTLEAKPIYWMCRNRSIVRTLQIENREGGCRTHYGKDGVDSVVSQAQTTSGCVSVFANIRRNLESAGWKCKDISQARISENL